jgi:hypothetical protein
MDPRTILKLEVTELERRIAPSLLTGLVALVSGALGLNHGNNGGSHASSSASKSSTAAPPPPPPPVRPPA